MLMKFLVRKKELFGFWKVAEEPFFLKSWRIEKWLEGIYVDFGKKSAHFW